ERRLRSLEQQVERVGGRTSASTTEVAERAGAAIAPVLSSIADRFRGGALHASARARACARYGVLVIGEEMKGSRVKPLGISDKRQKCSARARALWGLSGWRGN